MKLLYVALMALFVITVGCNKSNSGRTNSYSATTYYWSGNLCYSSATGQPVATTSCPQTCNTTTAVNGYYRVNNLCYSSYTGTTVADTYCAASCNTGVNGTVTMQCVGQYIYNGQTVTCANPATYAAGAYVGYGVYNCAGATVSDSTGRQIYCQ